MPHRPVAAISIPGADTTKSATPDVRPIDTDRASARRLILASQRLLGPLPKRPNAESILELVRDLCYVQIDPVNVLGPAQVTTLWTRLGPFRVSDLDRLLWKERRLFQYVVHAAAIVRTDEYPLYASFMERYPESLSQGWGSWRDHARRWIPRHAKLSAQVLRELRDGPRRINQFTAHRPRVAVPGGGGRRVTSPRCCSTSGWRGR